MMNRLFFSPLFVSTSDDEPTFLLPLICVDNRSIDRSTDRPLGGMMVGLSGRPTRQTKHSITWQSALPPSFLRMHFKQTSLPTCFRRRRVDTSFLLIALS